MLLAAGRGFLTKLWMEQIPERMAMMQAMDSVAEVISKKVAFPDTRPKKAISTTLLEVQGQIDLGLEG